MAKASPAITNFNAGEFSPLLDGRFDLQKYPNAASVLENFVPTVQGPIRKRPGTRFVNSSRNEGACVLVPFEFSVSQAYMVEFGAGYARFHTADSSTGQRGTLVGSDGKAVEVSTPYALSDVVNADGSTRLRYAQSGDVLYVCCPNFPVYLLKRTSGRSFSFSEFEAKNGPFDDLDDSWITVCASATTGDVVLTASWDIFTSNMVGSLFYLEIPKWSAIKPWTVDEPIWPGNLRKSAGCTYIAQNNAYTGTVKPVHTEGEEWDGPNVISENYKKVVGVRWLYSDPGYGHVKITGFINSRQVAARVMSERLPANVVGSENATGRWAFGSWSRNKGFPTSVAFFRSRLWFARGQKVWGSVAEDFSDFAAKNFGDVTADMAISITLASGQINDIEWLLPGKDLIAGTAGGEFAIGELSNGDALGPDNVRAVLQSEYGSKAIQPVKNGSSILFVQRAGLKAREFSYNMGADGYASTDATILSEHITVGRGIKSITGGVGTERSYGVAAIAFAQEPDPVVWMVRTDKQLIGFTWNNEQDVDLLG